MPNQTTLPLTTNPTDIALNEREETLQFIGRPPGIFLRFGISAIAVGVILFLSLAYLIKYPDIVTAKALLTTENPPIRMMSKISGRVSEMLTKNNLSVRKGDILAVMENTADRKDVLMLEKAMAAHAPMDMTLPDKPNLGSLQGAYSSFTQNLKDYRYFMAQNGVVRKIQSLDAQTQSIRQLNENLEKQKAIQAQEFELTEKEMGRQEQLHKEGVVSDADLEKTRAQYLQQKRQMESNEAAFINNKMQIEQNTIQINDLGQSKNDNQNTKEIAVIEDLRKLKAAIEEWKQTYLITAPIAGTVSFSKVWSAQQTVSAGDEILTIVPGAGESKVVCKVTLPIAQSGKIKTGLQAIVRLDAFPYLQYGILKGIVSNVSLVPQKDDYQVDIALSQTLKTSYGKILDFKQEMQGSANIITEDRRVMERILDKFHDLMKNRN